VTDPVDERVPISDLVVDLAELPGIPCPCGIARRAFAELKGSPLSLHLTEISRDARTHYHRDHAETYYVLACGPDAAMELDGEQIPVRVGTAIHIPAGVRHRAVGEMTILNIVVPGFDPADEHFDSASPDTA